jgi:hypothetical protein
LSPKYLGEVGRIGTDQRMFRRLPQDQQMIILNQATPEERQRYRQFTRACSHKSALSGQSLAPWRATLAFHGAYLGMTVFSWFLRSAAGRFALMQGPELNNLL